MLKDSLNLLLNIRGVPVTISRLGTVPLSASIKIAPSNYVRNLEVNQQTVSSGREFVISRDALDQVSFPFPKRGDKLTHTDLGTMTISEVIEMFDLGGTVMAFRVRTN